MTATAISAHAASGPGGKAPLSMRSTSAGGADQPSRCRSARASGRRPSAIAQTRTGASITRSCAYACGAPSNDRTAAAIERTIEPLRMAPRQVAERPGDRARDRRPGEADHDARGPVAGDRSRDGDEAQHAARDPTLRPARSRDRQTPATPAVPTTAMLATAERREAGDGAEDDASLSPADEERRQPEREMGFRDAGREDQDHRTPRLVAVAPVPVCECEPERRQGRPLPLNEERPGAESTPPPPCRRRRARPVAWSLPRARCAPR